MGCLSSASRPETFVVARPEEEEKEHVHKLVDRPRHEMWRSESTEAVDSVSEHEVLDPQILRDLDTRAVTVPQLIQEVKGIYAGLVMVEKKRIEIVNQQAQAPTKLSKEQWQALIALHRTLLNEHCDFFSATHHPVTKNHELQELASQYAMPSRMWRYAIHSFLELLRHRLPDSLEHMLSFIYLAYSMMGLLMETVPDFLETWIECLGDLARYRMAIEEADLRDREVWSNTARTWYNLAADLSPNTGRIQHHLAVLARPNIVSQLFLYSKALVAAVPFKNAGESILLLFNPLMDQSATSTTRYQPADFNFVCAAAKLFRHPSFMDFREFASSLEAHMARSSTHFKCQGPEILSPILAMTMDFGNPNIHAWSTLRAQQQHLRLRCCDRYGQDLNNISQGSFGTNDKTIPSVRSKCSEERKESQILPDSCNENSFQTSDDVSRGVGCMLYEAAANFAADIGNQNTVSYMYQVLVALFALSYIPGAFIYIEACVPWEQVVRFLNTVGRSGITYDRVQNLSPLGRGTYKSSPQLYESHDKSQSIVVSKATQVKENDPWHLSNSKASLLFREAFKLVVYHNLCAWIGHLLFVEALPTGIPDMLVNIATVTTDVTTQDHNLILPLAAKWKNDLLHWLPGFVGAGILLTLDFLRKQPRLRERVRVLASMNENPKEVWTMLALVLPAVGAGTRSSDSFQGLLMPPSGIALVCQYRACSGDDVPQLTGPFMVFFGCLLIRWPCLKLFNNDLQNDDSMNVLLWWVSASCAVVVVSKVCAAYRCLAARLTRP